MVEPWLRGTLTEVDAIRRQILHALQLAGEDAEQWCAGLTTEAIHSRPFGAASVAFHLRHMARSLDRLLTYAELRQLNEHQLAQLESEAHAGEETRAVLEEFRSGLLLAAERILRIGPDRFSEAREVGRRRMVTTAGGLLVHCAEHTQRHIGQAITTAKIVTAMATPANTRAEGE